jgi:hypothetical protein
MGRLIPIIIALFAISLTSAKDEPKWKMATVLYTNHEFSNAENVAGEGSREVQFVRERFDLLCDSITYTVEQWVVPNQMLRLRPGLPVQFAINGKKVTLRTPDGKTRKLNLVDPSSKPRKTAP